MDARESTPVSTTIGREPGLYLRVPFGFYGMRVDHFLVDPPSLWVPRRPGDVFLVPHEGANHAFATVPLSRYPYAPDLVEEARVRGVSVRVPRGLDLAQLTPEVSELLVAHPRAVAVPRFDVSRQTYAGPYRRCAMRGLGDDIPCGFHRDMAKSHEDEAREHGAPADLGALWPLSTLHSVKRRHAVARLGEGRFRVETPTASYEVARPEAWVRGNVTYDPGVVFRFPSFFLEVVDPTGEIPPAIQRRADRAGWELWVATQ